MERSSVKRNLYLPLILLMIVSFSACDVFKSDGSGDTNEGEGEEEPTEEPTEEPPAETTWYKGNLHAHSYWTDGEDYPDMILDWYKEQDYNFAVVSGHNHIHEGEQSYNAATDEDQIMFDRYLNTFGEDWVSYEEGDTSTFVGLKTYPEYSNQLTNGDFLAVRAQEVDYRDINNPNYDVNRLIHVNAVNVQELIEPSEGGTTPEILQEALDKVEAQGDQHNVPMLAVVNHPNIRESISADDLKQLNGARFFEVYNGHPNARNEGYGGENGLASTEELWDEVLTDNLLNDKGLLYGVAGDDSHGYNFDNGVTPDANLPGRGWIQVQAEELTPASIVNAMNDGKFYASTGVELSNVTYEDGTLKIWVEEESGVSYTTQFIGTKSGQPNNPGVVLAEEEGAQASYTLADDDLYVRAKVISDKAKDNASSTDEMEVAYVQPVTL